MEEKSTGISIANLNVQMQEKKCLIAQHRGAHAGNIVQNTIPAFKAAMLLGADIFELDVSKSTDGTLYCFHDATEEVNLRLHTNIEKFSSAAIAELGLYNSIWEPSGYPIQKMEDVLREFCYGELFNVDRSWNKLTEVFELLNKYPHALQQVLMKAPAEAEILEKYENESTKFMFIGIARSLEDIERVLSYENINVVGFELITEREDSPLWQDALIENLHAQGYFVWYNAITLSCMPWHVLSAGYDDDRSIKEGFDRGWGVLLRKNVDIIQTDWPALLSGYRDRLAL